MAGWDRCYWLSRAYIEASMCLSHAMLEEEFSSQYSSSRVIIHLARHGIELFLKASILAANGSAALHGHNLEKLLSLYRECYPGESFQFDAPPQFALGRGGELFPDSLGHFHSTLDQRHRYPEDRIGTNFADPEVFDPQGFIEAVGKLDKQLKIIEFAHIRPLIRGRTTESIQY